MRGEIIVTDILCHAEYKGSERGSAKERDWRIRDFGMLALHVNCGILAQKTLSRAFCHDPAG